MRIIIRPIGESRDLDVTEWLIAAIAAQLERCGHAGKGDCTAECTRNTERNRRAAKRHLRVVIEGFRALAEEAFSQKQIGDTGPDAHQVGRIFAFPDMLGDGNRRIAPAAGVLITDNTRRVRIRMTPKLAGADGSGRILGTRSGAGRAAGEKAAAQ